MRHRETKGVRETETEGESEGGMRGIYREIKRDRETERQRERSRFQLMVTIPLKNSAVVLCT